MNDNICEKCGLKNSSSAQACTRCSAPLEGTTQVTLSPFMQTAIDLPILPTPTPKPRTHADLPASARPTAPLPSHAVERRPPSGNEEVTRVVQQAPQVPANARPEPSLGDFVRPSVRHPSRAQNAETTVAAPIPAKPPSPPMGNKQPGQTMHTLMSRATEAMAPAQMPPSRPSLRERLSTQATDMFGPNPTDRPVTQAASQHGIVAARLRQHAAALAIDAVVLTALVWLVCVVGSALGHHGYPAERPTAFENLALWLARSGSTPLRSLMAAFILVQVYVGVGALRGHTLGRAVMGLVLVNASGRPVGLSGALWHTLGGALTTLAFGGGIFWLVVDNSHRTWASLLSHTQVVPKHQVMPR
jgi:uncharacterized RDD family membrane protein YckC